MSKDQNKVPLNLYGILDNEMSRMHALLQAYLALPSEDNGYGVSHHRSFSSKRQDIPELYKRIIHMQDTLLTALASHDKLIQDKVAELALTGDKDEV